MKINFTKENKTNILYRYISICDQEYGIVVYIYIGTYIHFF